MWSADSYNMPQWPLKHPPTPSMVLEQEKFLFQKAIALVMKASYQIASTVLQGTMRTMHIIMQWVCGAKVSSVLYFVCMSNDFQFPLMQCPASNAQMDPFNWWVGTPVMEGELRCVKEGAGDQCVLVMVGGAHWMQL